MMIPKNARQKSCAFLTRFLATFFLTGSIKFGAVLFDSISTSDGFSSSMAGLLFILPYSMARILGPVVNRLMKYFNPRTLASFGGFIFGAGYILSGLCHLSPPMMFIFFTISGVGLSCVLLPTVFCLAVAFKDNFRAVMPIAMLGSYVGVTVIPTWTVYILEEHGTRATLLLFGAMSWNLIPCGLLLNVDAPGADSKGSRESSDQKDRQEITRTSHNATSTLNPFQDSVLSGVKHLKNVDFLLFFVVANIRKIPNDAWMLYLIPHTIDEGLSATSAAVVGSTGGVGGVLGKLVAGISFNTSSSTLPLLLFSVYFILNGIIFVGMEIWGYSLNIFWLHFAASFFNGLFLSAQSGMVAGVLHLLVSPESYLSAFAIVDMGNGFWSLLAGFGPGLLLETVHDHRTTFLILGYCSGLCGFLLLLVWLGHATRKS